MLPREVTVQFLDHRHQVWIKPGDLNAAVAQAQFATASYVIVRVKSSDEDFPDAPLYYSFGARNLRMIPRSARLQGGEERCPRQRRIRKFLLKQSELRVLSFGLFAAESFPNHQSVTRNDRADLRGDLACVALALPRELDGPEH